MRLRLITKEDYYIQQITHHLKNVFGVGFHCHLGKEIFQTEHNEVRIGSRYLL